MQKDMKKVDIFNLKGEKINDVYYSTDYNILCKIRLLVKEK